MSKANLIFYAYWFAALLAVAAFLLMGGRVAETLSRLEDEAQIAARAEECVTKSERGVLLVKIAGEWRCIYEVKGPDNALQVVGQH